MSVCGCECGRDHGLMSVSTAFEERASELKNNQNARATISNKLLTIQIMQISSRRAQAATVNARLKYADVRPIHLYILNIRTRTCVYVCFGMVGTYTCPYTRQQSAFIYVNLNQHAKISAWHGRQTHWQPAKEIGEQRKSEREREKGGEAGRGVCALRQAETI